MNYVAQKYLLIIFNWLTFPTSNISKKPYVFGNTNLPLFYDLITDNEPDEFQIFYKNCNDIEDNLESLYFNYFNLSHITFEQIQEYIINITNELLSKFSIKLDNLMDEQGYTYFCNYKTKLYSLKPSRSS